MTVPSALKTENVDFLKSAQGEERRHNTRCLRERRRGSGVGAASTNYGREFARLRDRGLPATFVGFGDVVVLFFGKTYKAEKPRLLPAFKHFSLTKARGDVPYRIDRKLPR